MSNGEHAKKIHEKIVKDPPGKLKRLTRVIVEAMEEADVAIPPENQLPSDSLQEDAAQTFELLAADARAKRIVFR